MAADIINLRRARKARGRTAARAEADANAARWGRTKAAREAEAREAEAARRRLDGHEIEEAPEDGPTNGDGPKNGDGA